MKFTKFGKALCLGALSAGVIFGVTSCIESYATGYLYVTGTVTASTGDNGIISGFSIDHNTGKLTPVRGLPISSGGANPVRAVLTLGSRFLYVLNRGVNGSGSGDCYGTGANACQNANVTEFVVGGNGILTPQETFYTEGINPFRLAVDVSGNYLLVLDHDAPDNANPTSTDNCERALGTLGTGTPVTTCGDITVFQINPTTGRLSLVVNAQVTAAGGSSLTYFPVPANPVDFVLSSNTLLTLTGAPTPTAYPYTGGSTVWPYTYTTSSGQLTLSQNGVQQLNDSTGPLKHGTAIVNTSTVIYVLDNEPITSTSFVTGETTNAASQIIPYTLSGSTLDAEASGIIPDDQIDQLSNPIYVLLESKGTHLYVANQGNNVTATNNPESGIAGYIITGSPNYFAQYIGDEPFGSGSGPQCIVEDPSDQFVYEANEYDSTVTGRLVDPDTGDLNNLRVTSTYTLQGPPTWCLVDGRTS